MPGLNEDFRVHEWHDSDSYDCIFYILPDPTAGYAIMHTVGSQPCDCSSHVCEGFVLVKPSGGSFHNFKPYCMLWVANS